MMPTKQMMGLLGLLCLVAAATADIVGSEGAQAIRNEMPGPMPPMMPPGPRPDGPGPDGPRPDGPRPGPPGPPGPPNPMQACREDFMRFCAFRVEDMQNPEQILQCMNTHLSELTPICHDFVENATKKVAAFHTACDADVATVCPGTSIGESMKTCLSKNLASLSKGCLSWISDFLADMDAHRGPHGGPGMGGDMFASPGPEGSFEGGHFPGGAGQGWAGDGGEGPHGGDGPHGGQGPHGGDGPHGGQGPQGGQGPHGGQGGRPGEGGPPQWTMGGAGGQQWGQSGESIGYGGRPQGGPWAGSQWSEGVTASDDGRGGGRGAGALLGAGLLGGVMTVCLAAVAYRFRGVFRRGAQTPAARGEGAQPFLTAEDIEQPASTGEPTAVRV